MRHYTILLIDYDPRSIERTRKPLADTGFTVHVATDGIAGLAAFLEEEPDLVIIEAMLPKKHGFEVCQEVKRTAHGKRTPVLIQTAVYKGRKYRSQAMHIYGADEYLEKPYTDESLLETVRTRLGIAPGDRIGANADAQVPHDPEHPADAEITRRLDDLFAIGVDRPAPAPSPKTPVGRAAAAAAPALAIADDATVDSGPEKAGELVDFERHRTRRGQPATPPRQTVLTFKAETPQRRGLPVWIWAALVGSVVVTAYLVFAQSL